MTLMMTKTTVARMRIMGMARSALVMMYARRDKSHSSANGDECRREPESTLS
jgi:hypothetical protein